MPLSLVVPCSTRARRPLSELLGGATVPSAHFDSLNSEVGVASNRGLRHRMRASRGGGRCGFCFRASACGDRSWTTAGAVVTEHGRAAECAVHRSASGAWASELADSGDRIGRLSEPRRSLVRLEDPATTTAPRREIQVTAKGLPDASCFSFQPCGDHGFKGFGPWLQLRARRGTARQLANGRLQRFQAQPRIPDAWQWRGWLDSSHE